MFTKILLLCALSSAVAAVPTRRQTHFTDTYPRLQARDGYVPPERPDGNIVGGTVAEPHSYPWQAALWLDYNWFCSGSLIADTWILTAAHCLKGFSTAEVVLGASNPRITEESQTRVRSSVLTIHEDFGSNFYTNDIGVIELPSPVNYTDIVQPIALSPRDPGVGSMVMISGWGFQSDDDYYLSDLAEQIMELEVKVITDTECKEAFGARHWEQDICLDGTGGVGSCSGDSGGPVQFDLYEDGNYLIAGVCSFGANNGCELGYPSAYTSVENYLGWIESKTGVVPQTRGDTTTTDHIRTTTDHIRTTTDHIRTTTYHIRTTTDHIKTTTESAASFTAGRCAYTLIGGLSLCLLNWYKSYRNTL